MWDVCPALFRHCSDAAPCTCWAIVVMGRGPVTPADQPGDLGMFSETVSGSQRGWSGTGHCRIRGVPPTCDFSAGPWSHGISNATCLQTTKGRSKVVNVKLLNSTTLRAFNGNIYRPAGKSSTPSRSPSQRTNFQNIHKHY